MKSQIEVKKAQNELARAVGDFMRYWGFRRIHGQLWLHIYLSPEPLSGAELTRLLTVSKALVSPALVELQKYGLIRAHEVDKKTKKYTAHPNVYQVIQKVLKERELKLIQKAEQAVHKLQKATQASADSATIKTNLERLSEVEKMTSTAHVALQFIIHQQLSDVSAEKNEK